MKLSPYGQSEHVAISYKPQKKAVTHKWMTALGEEVLGLNN